MRWSTLSVVVALLVATLATSAQATFSETIYTTTMNGLNVLPFPTFVEASGATVCLLDRNQNTLTCTVQTEGLEEVRTVHLSRGDVQSIGPIVYNFTRPLNHASFPTFFEETITLVDFPSYPIFQQKLDFLNGLWYIEAAAIDSVNDRIRGQLEQSDNYFAIMKPEETFPPVLCLLLLSLELSLSLFFEALSLTRFDLTDNQTIKGVGINFSRHHAGDVFSLCPRA